MGHLIQQKNNSQNLLMVWTGTDGKRITRSSGTSDRKEAQRLLDIEVGKVALGDVVTRETTGRRACTFDDAVRLYDDDLTKRKCSGRDDLVGKIALHLRPVFGTPGTRKLADITTARVEAYDKARRDAGAKRETINSELRVLRRLFMIAVERKRYRGDVPLITIPDAKNARTGFFERAQYDALQQQLSHWLRGPVTLAYFTGWRFASEVCSLRWSEVDLTAGVLRLDNSKNGEGRVFPFTPIAELDDALHAADVQRQRLQRDGVIVSHVFHRNGEPLVLPPRGSSRTGETTKWVRTDWAESCKRAGVVGRIPHDMRRTAVRDLMRAGVPLKTAMKLTGHKSMSVFLRYQIVDENDLTAAVTQLAARHALTQQQLRRTRTKRAA